MTPQLNFKTNTISNTIFIIDATIKKYRGLFESPIDLSKAVAKL